MSSRRASKRILNKAAYKESSSDSSDDEPIVKKKEISKPKIESSDDEPIAKKPIKSKLNIDSDSSESSLDECLKSADKIDLNSSFFDVQPKSTEDLPPPPAVSTLSDDESDTEPAPIVQNPFNTIATYQKTLDEAKEKISNFQKTFSSEVDIKELLAMGEGGVATEEFLYEDTDDEMEVVIEKVEETKSEGPKELQIRVELPGAPKKREVDVMASIKRKINQVKKEYQVYIHKVHLLCWIAHGNYVNSILNNEKLLGLALSIIPGEKCYPDGRITLTYIEQITKWFPKAIKLIPKKQTLDEMMKELPLLQSLQLQISKRVSHSNKDFVLLFILILRALGVQCRLVLNFRVAPIRPPASELLSLSTKDDTKKDKKKDKSPTDKAGKSGDEEKEKVVKSTFFEKVSPPKKFKSLKIPQVDGMNDERSPRKSRAKKISKVETKPPAKIAPKKSNTKSPPKESTKKISKPNIISPKKTRSQSQALKVPKITVDNSDSSDEDFVNHKQRSKSQTTNKIDKLLQYTRSKSISPTKQISKKPETKSSFFKKAPPKTKLKSSRKSVSKVSNDGSDSDFQPSPIKKRVTEVKKLDKRVLSTDEEEDHKKNKIGNDTWLEVFVEEEEKWISVDVLKGQVHCVQELHTRASQPVSYVLAWNNNGTLKDVTCRYSKNWNTVTRKLRVDPEWWRKTLKPYLEAPTARSKEEDEELAKQQLDKPLPTSIAEFKDHPLYVLKRHLLKFQAIYPPDPPTLGFIRGEAVYARECVHTLHSREIWVKQARVVKPGEQPYKIVKARPKWDRQSGTCIKDIPLEIFGIWQTMDYDPPTAENGIVPRNAYGNVELFKKCMLPKKTVHLQLPGLNKVSKKLGIDCANAVVGFDYHSGSCHPTFEGFVVCEEFKDTLIAAWEQEQVEAEKRAQEKIDKRVYGNWKRLIKGLLIRERLEARYNFGEPKSTTATKKIGKECKKKVEETKKKPNNRKVISDSDSD